MTKQAYITPVALVYEAHVEQSLLSLSGGEHIPTDVMTDEDDII